MRFMPTKRGFAADSFGAYRPAVIFCALLKLFSDIKRDNSEVSLAVGCSLH